ncbi:MAG: phosphate regulon sensor histidine kinase PhoR [Pseudomonadota bacterium]
MQEDLWKIASALLLGALIGNAFGLVLPALLIVCIGVIVWQIRRLKALSRWIDNPNAYHLPETGGQLYTILRKLSRRDKKNRLRKRQLTGFLSQVRRAIGALPDAIVLIDREGKIEWANNNALSVLGIRWPADTGLRFTDLVRYPELERQLAKEPSTPHGIEVSSNSARDTILNIKCVEYTDDLRMVIARDVTRLVRINQIQRDFVANVSHELKTPLTVLRGYLEIMEDNSDIPERYLKPLQQMNIQSVRMELIVADLLYLAKLENVEDRPEYEVIDVTQMINTIIEAVQPLIEENRHKIELDVDYDLQIMGSSTELHSAFTNLVTNAINYTQAQGLIKIQWQASEDGAQFSILDNGVGIDAHHIERLTQRFYRVDTNRSREGGGTGLGLAIVKHVLQRHNAQLEVHQVHSTGKRPQSK